jgi:hypothetical protein
VACNHHNIPSGLYGWQILLYGVAQQAFGAVSAHRISDGSTGCHPKPGVFGLIWESDQHNQRVGVRLSNPPHPLEIGRSGQTEFAVHSSAPASIS